MLRYEQTLLAGEDIVKVLVASERLYNNVGILLLGCCEQNQLIVLLHWGEKLDQVWAEFYVDLQKNK